MIVETLYKTEQQEKWARHYYKLCNRALDRKPTKGVYYEQHHMFPRCQWGENKILVLLTPEEHYVAHQLLVKMFPNDMKLIYGARMLTFGSEKTERSNNKIYGWLKKRVSDAQRERMKNSGANAGSFNKGNTPWNKGKTGVQQSPRKGKKIGPQTDEHRTAIAEGNRGKVLSMEHRKNISKGKFGKKQTVITCPHCGFSGGVSGLKRYHFSNCKEKN